jgi:SAM-dependent methyltransferase
MSKIVKNEEIRKVVRETYGEIAENTKPGCGCSGDHGLSGNALTAEQLSEAMGYSGADVSSVPEGANMGLGCGNPQAIASLKPGETVLDLGSGGGFDCFLAADAVGKNGHVIGVDMTPEMIGKARANAETGGFDNVEFRLGEIEHLPAADQSVDAIISNCVVNLSPEKSDVFKEAFRVLKPGGRLAISDIVATAELPEEIKKDLASIAGCVAGAAHIDLVHEMLEEAGFTEIRVEPILKSRELIREWTSNTAIADFVTSATIQARKP